jgi:hypothetical protein
VTRVRCATQNSLGMAVWRQDTITPVKMPPTPLPAIVWEQPNWPLYQKNPSDYPTYVKHSALTAIVL